MITPPERERENVTSRTTEPDADGGLLRRYVRDRDEVAFRSLVESHVDFVYSSACRRLGGDTHSAADVTQQVFTALARQAPKLPNDVVLPAWLYVTTRHLTANWVRAEQSRRAREQVAQRLHEMNAASAPAEEWDQIRPLLDAVLDEIGERDRDAVLLRFFSRRSYADIGTTLQVSEDAARMRVERALEKLRAALARRGVSSSAAALGGVLTHMAVTAAPGGMAAAVVSVALQGGSAAAGILTFMTWTKLTAGLAAALAVAGVVGFTLQRDRNVPAVIPSASAAAVTGPAAVAAHVAAVPAPSVAAPVVTTQTGGTEGPIYPQISLPEVLGPNNLFYDSVTGVSMTYPPGWVVRDAKRWGDRNRENTVFFSPPAPRGFTPSMYYNMYPYGAPPPVTTEEFLRTSAQKKEEQRVSMGMTDYKNAADSFVFREIEGRPSMSYFATYTQGDRVMAEYFMRILGQKGYVMFFVRGPAAEIQAQIPTIHQMGTTVRVP